MMWYLSASLNSIMARRFGHIEILFQTMNSPFIFPSIWDELFVLKIPFKSLPSMEAIIWTKEGVSLTLFLTHVGTAAAKKKMH